jgi:cyclopropane fatty-acyl-phospholipid synthase-like methyltransferase
LDVGGGSGAYSIAFVRRSERIRATVFDLPQVIPLTKKYIEREGLSDRVDTIAGDYTQDHLGKGYDLVFLSQVIHSNSFDENTELMAKAASALNPGGQVVIQDFIMSEDRVSPSMGAIFALNMLVATSAGDTYTESEVRRMMAQAGLSSVKRLDTDFNTALIIVKKE